MTSQSLNALEDLPEPQKVIWLGNSLNNIAVKFNKDAYRCVQAIQLGKTIYVLHAFQKKSSTGTKTPQKDVDLTEQRYNEAQELAKDE